MFLKLPSVQVLLFFAVLAFNDPLFYLEHTLWASH